MIRFILLSFLGVLLLFCLILMIIGCMYVLRVCLDLWFDIDFMEKIREFIKEYKDES